MRAFLHLFIQQTFTQHILGGSLCNRHRAITVNKIFSLLLRWLLEEVALKHRTITIYRDLNISEWVLLENVLIPREDGHL